MNGAPTMTDTTISKSRMTRDDLGYWTVKATWELVAALKATYLSSTHRALAQQALDQRMGR